MQVTVSQPVKQLTNEQATRYVTRLFGEAFFNAILFGKICDNEGLQNDFDSIKGHCESLSTFLEFSFSDLEDNKPLSDVYNLMLKVQKALISISYKMNGDLCVDEELYSSPFPTFSKELEELLERYNRLKNTGQQETDLKNSCFGFLIRKGLYEEWQQFHYSKK